ncbi:MAG: DUF1566 domain-containing protein [Lachnospiraceae bacterium]|nr:DUF1566 domain-containing protein [Lachnospiraceae bacterium]
MKTLNGVLNPTTSFTLIPIPITEINLNHSINYILMTEQELKLEALDKVCVMQSFSLREIADFLATPLTPSTSNTAKNADSIPVGRTIYFEDSARPDGVYICYKNGDKELFDGNNSKENVSHIGIKFGNHLFGLQLHDKGTFQLLRDGVNCPEKAAHYTRGKRNCFEDFDYIEATKRIQDLGTDIPLEDGEYLPTMGLWGIMMMFATLIQKALAYVGGDELTDDDWYWSASEYSQDTAWYVYFNDGSTSTYIKCYSSRVRAVVAF